MAGDCLPPPPPVPVTGPCWPLVSQSGPDRAMVTAIRRGLTGHVCCAAAAAAGGTAAGAGLALEARPAAPLSPRWVGESGKKWGTRMASTLDFFLFKSCKRFL